MLSGAGGIYNTQGDAFSQTMRMMHLLRLVVGYTDAATQDIVSTDARELAASSARAFALLDSLAVQLGQPAQGYAHWKHSMQKAADTAAAYNEIGDRTSATTVSTAALSVYARVVGRCVV